VQGVGFRPFIERLARQQGLSGVVQNSGQSVQVEVQGPLAAIERFRNEMQAESLAAQQWMVTAESECPVAQDATAPECFEPESASVFKIASSVGIPAQRLPLVPDRAICVECREELADSTNRRYGYPFISCARCGPRFSIATLAPFDRERTTMASFPPCAACVDEYDSLTNRRYHAQTISCRECGPQLKWLDAQGIASGERDASRQDPMAVAVSILRGGGVVAIKAVSGFHLVALAANTSALARLGQLKNRQRKPFAVMFPSLDAVHASCQLSAAEAQWLTGPAAPIVLLDKRVDGGLADAATGTADNPRVGAMLPACATHLLLLSVLQAPVFMTSLNRQGAPLISRNEVAIEQFCGAVDGFLLHDLDIHFAQDDSIVQRVAGRKMVLRRGRGYGPETLNIHGSGRAVAAGAWLKNSVALLQKGQIVVSHQLGDLDNVDVLERQRDLVNSLVASPATVTLLEELHPDMAAPFKQNPDQDRFSHEGFSEVMPIQHHVAHASAVKLEHGVDEPHLAIVWDGLGYGADGSWWGGECFEMIDSEPRHRGQFRPFLLPGGVAAVRQNSRVALSLLFQVDDKQRLAVFSKQLAENQQSLHGIRQLLEKQLASPICSSAGRFVEGCASLLGLVHQNEFEGDAASALQYAAERADRKARLPPLSWQWVDEQWQLDWRPLVQAVARTPWQKVPVERAALAIHQRLAEAIVEITERLAFSVVTLSGGCFQNRLLVELVKQAAERRNIHCYWPQRFSPNDSSIALGQIGYYLDQRQTRE